MACDVSPVAMFSIAGLLWPNSIKIQIGLFPQIKRCPEVQYPPDFNRYAEWSHQ